MKIENYLKEKGFVRKKGMWIRYSSPRIGYNAVTGELIIGYHSMGKGLWGVEDIDPLIHAVESDGFAQYHRNPTAGEIKFGYGAIHYIAIPLKDALKPDGKLKRWIIGKDGLRYYR